MIEVGDVRRPVAAPADLDRLLERVQVPVAERVAHVRVIEAAMGCRLAGERGQLIGAGVGAGRVVESRRETDGALLHRLSQHRAHVRDIRVGGLHLLPADGAHPQRAVSDQEREVDRWMKCVEAVEVRLDRAPIVRRCLRRRAVQPGVHVDQRLEVTGVRDRRIAQAVDADDLGGDALPHLRLVQRVGEDHQAGVAVEVDEPGADDEPCRVDAAVGRDVLLGLAEDEAEPPVPDADRGREAVGSAAVDDRPVLDDQVERFAHAGGDQLWSSTTLPSGSVT